MSNILKRPMFPLPEDNGNVWPPVVRSISVIHPFISVMFPWPSYFFRNIPGVAYLFILLTIQKYVAEKKNSQQTCLSNPGFSKDI